MNRRSRRRQRKGFTLLELMLVLAILVVLGGTVTLYFSGLRKGADADTAKSQMSILKTAVQAYQLHTGKYPTDLQGLVSPPSDLVDPSKWRGPYLDTDEVPLDPWGQPYQFQHAPSQAGGTRDVLQFSSAGPDGAPNTADDITLK